MKKEPELLFNGELVFTENGRMYQMRRATEKFLEMEVSIAFLSAEEAEEMIHRWFPEND